MPQQPRHLQRLHPVRLAHDRHLDGKRTVRLGLQPALRPLLSGGRTARKAARGESFHLGCPGESGTLPRHRPRHLGQDDMPCERCELHRHLRFEQRRGPLSGQTAAGPYVGELHVFPALHPAGQDAQQLPAQTLGQHQLLAHARRRTARRDHREAEGHGHQDRSGRTFQLQHRQETCPTSSPYPYRRYAPMPTIPTWWHRPK